MKDLSNGSPEVISKSVYDGFRSAGLSHDAALVMTGEVGRENGMRTSLIFGTHSDPHNKVTNTGLISWQGSRKQALDKYLTEGGFMVNGKMQATQETINAQAKFLVGEMKEQTPKVYNYLNSGSVNPQVGMDMVGRDFIRWRINDPVYRTNGMKNRQHFYDLGVKVVGSPSQISPISSPEKNGLPPLPGSQAAAAGNPPGGLLPPTALPETASLTPEDKQKLSDLSEPPVFVDNSKVTPTAMNANKISAIPGDTSKKVNLDIGQTNVAANNLRKDVDFNSNITEINKIDPNFFIEQGGMIDNYRNNYNSLLKQVGDAGDMLNTKYKQLNDLNKSASDVPNPLATISPTDVVSADLKFNQDNPDTIKDSRRFDGVRTFFENMNVSTLGESALVGMGAARSNLENSLRDYITQQSENSWYGKLGRYTPEATHQIQSSMIMSAWQINGAGKLKLFKPDAEFNAGDYITQQMNNNRDLQLREIDETGMNRILNSRSVEEFNHEWSLGLQRVEDVKQYSQSSLGMIAGELSGFTTDPLTLTSTAVTGGLGELGAAAAATKAGLTGWRATGLAMAGGIAGDSAGYAALQYASGKTYTSHDVFNDLVFGGLTSIGLKGAAKGIKAFNKMSRDMNEINAAEISAQRGIEQQVRDENPAASAEEIQAETQRRLNNVNAVSNAPESANLSADPATWNSRQTADYNQLQRDINANQRNIDRNIERRNARSSEEAVRSIENEALETRTRDAELAEQTPGANQIVQRSDGSLEIDKSLESPNTPREVIENVRRAVDEVNSEMSLKPRSQQAADALSNMKSMDLNVPKSIAQSSENKFKNFPINQTIKEKTGLSGLQVKWTQAWQDVAYRGQFNSLNKAVKSVASKVVDEKTLDPELFKALNTEIRSRIDDLPNKITPENISDFGSAGKSRKGNSRLEVNFDKIWSPNEVEKFVVDFYKNKAPDVATPEVKSDFAKRIGERLKSQRSIDGEQIRVPLTGIKQKILNETSTPAMDLPANNPKVQEHLKDLDPAKDMPEKSLREIYKMNGIDEKFWDVNDPDKAFKMNLIEKNSVARVKSIESTITAARLREHSKRLDNWYKAAKGTEKLEAPTIDLLGSENLVVRNAAYGFENPIGAVINRTAPMIKIQTYNKMMKGVERAYDSTKRSYVENFTDINKLGDFFTGSGKRQFDDDFYSYYSLTSAERSNHPMHDTFKDYAEKLGNLFEMDMRLRKTYDLEGSDVLPSGRVENYIPSKVDPKKLQSLTSSQRNAYIDTLSKSIVESNPNITIHEAEKFSMALIENASALRAQGKNIPGSFTGTSTWQFVEEALNGKFLDLSDVERVQIIDKVKRSMENMRFRKLDRNMNDVISTPEGNFSLSDIMVKDLFDMARNRAQETSGKVALKDVFGFRNTADVELYAQVMKANKATNANIENFNMMIAETLGQPYGNKQPGSGSRIAMCVARSLMLQKAGFAQMMEYGNLVMGLGLVDGIKAGLKSPSLSMQSKSLARTGKAKNELMKTIQDSGFSHSDEVYSPISFVNVDRFVDEVPVLRPEEVSNFAKVMTGVEMSALKLEDLTNRMSMMKFFLAGQTAAVMDTVIKRAVKKYGKNALDQDADLVAAGFSPDIIKNLDELGALIRDNKGNLIDINLQKAGTAGEEFMISARRFTDQVIQASHIGERGRWFHEGSWRLAMMMRSYTLAGIGKQTARRLSMNGITKTMFHTMGWAAFNAPIYASRVLFTAAVMDDDKADNYLEKNLDGYKMFTGGLAYVGTTSVGGDLMNALMSVANPEMSNFKLGSSGLAGQILPILGPPTMVAQAVDAVAGTVRGEDKDLSRVTKVIPLANTPAGSVLMSGIDSFYDATTE